MKKYALVLLFLITLLSAYAQTNVARIIIDKETSKPIPFAHVYFKDNLLTGTISNTDGRFVLKNIKENDTLVISHLSYETFSNKVKNIQSDTIYLIPKTENIKEVTVTALSGYSIMEKVIDALPKNHFTRNTMYQTFTRIIEYEEDYSEIHILGEYLLNLYENKNGKYNYQVVKIRVKPFSSAGEKSFADYRMILAIATFGWADILDEDIFNKRKLKAFLIDLKGEYSDEQGVYIKLICKPKKTNKKYENIVLYIDKASLGIMKCIINYSDTEFNEVVYHQIGNKWYIANFKRKVKTDFYKELKYKKDSRAMLSWESVYNLKSTNSYNKENFHSYFDIIADPIKKYLGNWDDSFWENYNYIPLPDWIKEKIDSKK